MDHSNLSPGLQGEAGAAFGRPVIVLISLRELPEPVASASATAGSLRGGEKPERRRLRIIARGKVIA